MSNKSADNKHQEQAEQQLIHALLMNQYEAVNHSDNDQRIQKVMNTINKQDKSKLNRLKLLFFIPKLKKLSMAASVFFAVFMLSLLIVPNKNAMAEMNHLIDELQHVGDRLYQITVAPSSKTDSSHRINSNTQRPYKKSAAKWLNGASLYVRNQSDYLLMYKTKHNTKIKANNQQGSWKIDDQDSYQQSMDGKASKLPLSGQAAEMAIMDFPLLLNTLKTNYDLSYQEEVNLDDTQQTLSLITATRLNSEKGAKQIKIYYQPENYLIQKMIFEIVHLQGQSATYRIDLQLRSNKAFAVDFFKMEYHLRSN